MNIRQGGQSMSVEISNFQVDVLDESRTQPVLVDFWAEWCGPCRVLGPVLEKLAAAAAGRWKLVKVNVDQHQDLAYQFGIQGIPAVKLFDHGKIVGEFVGALPEPEIRSWLDEYLPNPLRVAFAEARQAAEEGRRKEAIDILERLVNDADDPDARSLLARLIVLEEPSRAAGLIQALDESTAGVDGVRDMLDILALDPHHLPDGDGKPAMAAALQMIRSSRWREALEKLIESIRHDKTYLDEAARKACIGVFRFLGDEHPLTVEFRPRFSMALF